MHARRISEEVTKMIIFLRIYLTAILLFAPIVIIFALFKINTLGNKLMFWIEDILIYTFWLLAAIGMLTGVVVGLKMIWSGAIV